MDRKVIAGLSLSAAALVALVAHEGYTDSAVIPVKGDVPTLGYGMTQREDGTPVQMGDTTTPVKALQRTMAYVQKQEAQMRGCITAPLHQGEYDLMQNFGYQYGNRRLCESSMVRLANAGDYAGSCKAYLAYRFQGTDKFDCSALINGKPNKRCYGVWTRQLERYNTCMSLQ